jgi:hypothetical protein
MSKVLEVSENKLIKISFAGLMIVIGGIFSFATWMTVLQYNTASHADSIADIEGVNKEVQRSIIDINNKLTTIETILRENQRRNRGSD